MCLIGILQGEAMDTRPYIRRFNFLMYFINKKKRVEIMLKGNAVTSSKK